MANQNFRVKNGLEVGEIEIANSSGVINASAIANSGVTAGTVGNTTVIPIITVDSRGFITDIQPANVELNPTGAEIKALYEAEADTNAFDDAAVTKLAGIETGATADQTGAEIKAAYEAEADTNAYDDAAVTKLAGIEAGATADQTAAEILTAIKTVDGAASGLDADLLDGNQASAFATAAQGALADSALQSETNTTLALSGNTLTYTDENGTATNIDLSAYLDEDSRAIASGTLNSVSGIVTFTRDDATTFTLDLSDLLDDTNLVTSVAGKNGVVTLDADDIDDTSTTNKFTTAAEITKLSGIETGATADQTGAEIKAAYEAEADTNAFDDAAVTKLAGIEASADVTDTDNVTAAGALMDSEVTNLVQVKAFDSSDYATAAQGALADSALQSETVTSIALNSNSLDYTDENGTTTNIDLSAYLDEDSRSIASGTLDAATGIVTFTRDDATTFTLNLSALLDDTNLVTSVAGKTGVVTLNADDIDDSATTNKFTTAGDISKLAGIETSATADQTGAEIKAAYEAEADTNAFTDDLLTKLSNIETSATADQTGAEIKALYEAETSAFTDALFTKLSNIETGATADQTGAEIKAAYEAEADTNAFTDTLLTKLTNIEANATADQTVTAGDGLTGGGTGDSTINVVAGLGITVNANDIAVNAQTGLTANATGLYVREDQVDHDSLLNYDANKHIDHTLITLTAGNGLTGGGTIAASRTFSVVGGTGVTSNATGIHIGQSVATTANVTFSSVDVDGDLRDGSNRVLKVYNSAGTLVWG